MFSGTVNLETLFYRYQDSKQKSIGDPNGVDSLINEVNKRAKDRLLNNDGTLIQKAESLQELIFMQMQGVEITWADFPISEIMMSENYSVKLMSYIAASQFWSPGSEVVMMIVSCINKDLLGTDPLRKSLALTLIPLISNSQFAEDVVANVAKNFNNPRNDIRQKAIACFYQLCYKYPACLPAGFKAINAKEVLADKDTPIGVVNTILTLLNELCHHKPSNFALFIPTLSKFFLQPGGSPWVLVRTLSIVNTISSSLEPSESQALGRKIMSQISEVLDTASSASVVFEVIKLICTIPINHRALVRAAAERAQSFIENSDPNLRYLGLISMTRLMQLDQKIIAHHREVISNCLQSDDQTCVIIAVDLLQSIASRKNIGDIVINLVSQIELRTPGSVRDTLVSRVIEICSHDDYERISDFEWYVNVLFEMQSYGVENKEISEQVLVIALRVESVRPVLVNEMLEFMKDPNIGDTHFIIAAAFILGEYSDDHSTQAFHLLLSSKVVSMSAPAQASCLQNAFKLYAKSKNEETFKELGGILLRVLPLFTSSRFTEVQERAAMFSSLVNIFQDSAQLETIGSLYSQPLKAISSTAQSKVPIPKSLDLATPIIDLDAPEPIFSFDEPEEESLSTNGSKSIFLLQPSKSKKPVDKKPSNVVVMSGNLGLDVQPKKRRMQPIEQNPVKLMPVEGLDEVTNSKKQTPKSPISKIEFNPVSKGIDTLPEIKPYSQDELIAKQNRQLLGSVKNAEPSSPVARNDVFREVGDNQGLGIAVLDITSRPNGLEILISVVNTSLVPISAIEFTLDDSATQCLRQELLPNDSVKHKLIYKSQPVLEPKIVKLTAIPTGGAGEMLRGKLRIIPTMFMSPGKSSDFNEALTQTTQRLQHLFEKQIQVQPTIQKLAGIIHGTIVKTEIDTKKVIGVYSTLLSNKVVLLLYKKNDDFVVEICTTDEKLSKVIQSLIKQTPFD